MVSVFPQMSSPSPFWDPIMTTCCHLCSNSGDSIPIRWTAMVIQSSMALHPISSFLLWLGWQWHGFLKLNVYNKEQMVTYRNLSEQKLRQIMLVLFSSLLRAVIFLTSFKHFIPPAYQVSFSFFSINSILLTCSSSIFYPLSRFFLSSLLPYFYFFSLVFSSFFPPGLLVHCSIPPAGIRESDEKYTCKKTRV